MLVVLVIFFALANTAARQVSVFIKIPLTRQKGTQTQGGTVDGKNYYMY